jgi:hypothetical protein
MRSATIISSHFCRIAIARIQICPIFFYRQSHAWKRNIFITSNIYEYIALLAPSLRYSDANGIFTERFGTSGIEEDAIGSGG